MRTPTCLCGERGVRDEKHDAYYCPKSGAWLEDACDIAGGGADHGADCDFCKDRPAAREVSQVSP